MAMACQSARLFGPLAAAASAATWEELMQGRRSHGSSSSRVRSTEIIRCSFSSSSLSLLSSSSFLPCRSQKQQALMMRVGNTRGEQEDDEDEDLVQQ
jgi:hypothetical protein